MPFPHALEALSRFTVFDLTRVRSGPTCVRISAHPDQATAPARSNNSDAPNAETEKRVVTKSS
ncbi:hypothetical protein I6F20_34365 [Bradyrhizobium sp. IC3123]|uniref:hypothetical protein n=1 Tax=unclassified Bradyrhizobium TaxID=2631580 RepID=UPI000D64FA0F|nr:MULTISPECIES: hypothetical protein [unclassified Bradyrhizobium]MCA1394100.1 hypothetical protein [Bradyrhizobium sp. IC3123]PWE77551.1 hypothetical protein XF30_13115 [Bradyrhizobium sp. SUTN9-2]